MICPDCGAFIQPRWRWPACPCGWQERNYQCPEFRIVRRDQLPIAAATAAVREANLAQYGTASEASLYFSAAESDLLAALWWYDLDPGLQARITSSTKRLARIDFVFPRQALAVEVDGADAHAARRDDDRERDAWLLAERFIRVVRIPARAVFDDPLAQARSVRTKLQLRRREISAFAVSADYLDPRQISCHWPSRPRTPLLAEHLGGLETADR